MSSGPVIAAMRVWPSSMRCRVAMSPPDQLALPTDGTSGVGSPAGSMTTKGIELALLPVGARLAIGDEVVLEISGPANPVASPACRCRPTMAASAAARSI